MGPIHFVWVCILAIPKFPDPPQTWVFYHDALTQMCCQKCIEWMRKKDYLKRWLLPRAGLNDKITRNDGKTSTDYRGRPPGNLPEVMEWVQRAIG